MSANVVAKSLSINDLRFLAATKTGKLTSPLLAALIGLFGDSP